MNATAESHKAEPAFRELLGELYERNGPVLTRQALRITGSPESAEDVLHNVFLKLLDPPPPRGFNRNPAGYLRQAVINEAIEAVRYRNRRTLMEANMEDSLISPSTAASRCNDEIQQRLADAISKLGTDVAALLALHYEAGLSCAEIAKVIGQSRARITMRLVRAPARTEQTDVRH
jgi:RNA polymerase sigma factor (sigma-70 family)